MGTSALYCIQNKRTPIEIWVVTLVSMWIHFICIEVYCSPMRIYKIITDASHNIEYLCSTHVLIYFQPFQYQPLPLTKTYFKYIGNYRKSKVEKNRWITTIICYTLTPWSIKLQCQNNLVFSEIQSLVHRPWHAHEDLRGILLQHNIERWIDIR